MDMTPELQQLWKDRAKQGEARRFLSKGYEAAVERLEDHREDEGNSHIHGPQCGEDAVAGEVLSYEGAVTSPEQSRREAFELLALADLAEIMAAPASDPETAA